MAKLLTGYLLNLAGAPSSICAGSISRDSRGHELQIIGKHVFTSPKRGYVAVADTSSGSSAKVQSWTTGPRPEGWAVARQRGSLASPPGAAAAPPYCQRPCCYLDNEETAAFLTACDKTSRTGRRDHAMFTLAIQTGLRVSELTSLTLTDLHLGPGPNIHCLGKGRKERRTPLVPDTVAVLTPWLHEQPDHDPGRFLFTTSTGRRLSPDAVQQRVTLTAAKASQSCMPLRDKHVTVHTLRHTAAMRLLHAGVDITVIALWLGHEHITTTNAYLHADMTHKQEAIARVETLGQATTMERYQPTDALLRFLDNL